MNEIDFSLIKGGCVGRDDKVVLIRSEAEMENFNFHYKERVGPCTEVTSKEDFKSTEVLFVGMFLGGNQMLDVNFSFGDNILQVILTVISPKTLIFLITLRPNIFS